MKHTTYTIYITLFCFNLHIIPMDEKTPLLQEKKDAPSKFTASNNHYLKQAITHLKKNNRSFDADELLKKIKQSKYQKGKTEVAKRYIQKFQTRVTFFKENYVIKDKHGNISECTSHKLEPVVDLLKKYVRSQK